MPNNYFLNTDVVPEEVPVLFSNNFLAKNRSYFENNIISSFKVKGDKKIESPKSLFDIPMQDKSGKNTGIHFMPKETKPLFFSAANVRKKERKLALLHPLAQYLLLQFVVIYNDRIIDVAKKSNFSVRSPRKLNSNEIMLSTQRRVDKIWQALNFQNQGAVTSEEDRVDFFHYFSYYITDKYGGMISSLLMNEAQNKFQFLGKIDVQNFFPSIYTHAIAWSLYGSKALAKNQKQDSLSFPNVLDFVMRSINFGETNGIVVGPEFSRIVAEMLLSPLDENVEINANREKKLRLHTDYFVMRFVDDIFIFANSKSVIEKVMASYKNEFNKVNLSINEQKVRIFDTPELPFINSIERVKQLLDVLKIQRISIYDSPRLFDNNSTTDHLTLSQNGTSVREIRGFKRDWENLFNGVQLELSKNPDLIGNLVHYALSVLPNHLTFKPSKARGNKIYPVIMTGLIKLLKSRQTYLATQSFIVCVTKLIDNLSIELKRMDDEDVIDSSDINYKSVLMEDMEFIFRELVKILDSKWFDFNEGYELLSFMRVFYKYKWRIPVRILQKILHQDWVKNFYFVYTAVGYYILDGKQIEAGYSTVYKVMIHHIKKHIDKISNRGLSSSFLDGEVFYILNDFHHYPGLNKNDQSYFDKQIELYIKNGEVNVKLYEYITSQSYFQWQAPFQTFLNKIIKKKIIHGTFTQEY